MASGSAAHRRHRRTHRPRKSPLARRVGRRGLAKGRHSRRANNHRQSRARLKPHAHRRRAGARKPSKKKKKAQCIPARRFRKRKKRGRKQHRKSAHHRAARRHSRRRSSHHRRRTHRRRTSHHGPRHHRGGRRRRTHRAYHKRKGRCHCDRSKNHKATKRRKIGLKKCSTLGHHKHVQAAKNHGVRSHHQHVLAVKKHIAAKHKTIHALKKHKVKRPKKCRC